MDKKERISASDITYAVNHEKLYQQLKAEQKLKPIPYHDDWNSMFDSKERRELLKASDQVEVSLTNQNLFASDHFYQPFLEYGSLSIEDAINSESVIIRAFAMFDRRLGKRRLEKLTLSENTHPLIKDFYKIRCKAEGIGVKHTW